MKRLLCVLLLLLLLVGCGAEPNTEPQETTEPAPVGLYEPDHKLEKTTGGAVRVYPLPDGDYMGLKAMGNRLLVEKDDGTITVYQGELCEEVALLPAEQDVIYLSSASVEVHAQGLAYYAPSENAVILLNPQMQETNRIVLPEDMQGAPVISQKSQVIFYCTPGQIRALDMQTGISRPIKTHSYPEQSLIGCYFDGQVIGCQLRDEQGSSRCLYLSAQDGSLLAEDNNLYQLTTYGERFFGKRLDGYVDQTIYGTLNGTHYELVFAEPAGYVTGALPMNGAVSYQTDGIFTTLRFHDLADGQTIAQVAMRGIQEPVAMVADSDYVWVLAQVDTAGTYALLRWDTEISQAQLDITEARQLYSSTAPDEAGIAQCKEQANAIAKQYGVKINVWQDAVAVTDGYQVLPEYNTQIISDRMALLETVLARFPKGFLAESVDRGTIRFGLVRSLEGGKDWVQFWNNSNCYVLISTYADMEEAALRGIGFAVDAHVLGHSRDYDFWDNRNPEGFAYTQTDGDQPIPEEYMQFLEGENKAFVDEESMCYPHIDRAYIYAEAMKEDNQELFLAPNLHAKYLRICEGIREAFNVEKVDTTYPWEVYLTEKMNFSNYNRD